MTKVGETYKCGVCGNTVKVVEAGQGQLVCDAQYMTLVPETEKPIEKPIAQEQQAGQPMAQPQQQVSEVPKPSEPQQKPEDYKPATPTA